SVFCCCVCCSFCLSFFSLLPSPLFSTLFPYTTLFRSVGLSGGADSVCLFLALVEYRKIVPFDLEVAHINHGVRGKDAENDEVFSDRKSTRLNSSHVSISYAVFCLKKKKKK